MTQSIPITGCITSAALLAYARYSLHAFCPWCTVSAFLFTAITILVVSPYVSASATHFSGLAKLGAITAAGASIVAVHVRLNPPQVITTGDGRVELTGIWPERKRILGGSESSPYKCIAFVDFTCPSCQDELLRLIPLAARQKNVAFTIRTRIMHGETAKRAAALSQTALRCGNFWQFAMLASQCIPDSADGYIQASERLGFLDQYNRGDLDAALQDNLVCEKAGIQSVPIIMLWYKGGFVGVVGENEVKELMTSSKPSYAERRPLRQTRDVNVVAQTGKVLWF